MCIVKCIHVDMTGEHFVCVCGRGSGGRSLWREEKTKVEGWLKIKRQPKMTTQGRELVSLHCNGGQGLRL